MNDLEKSVKESLRELENIEISPFSQNGFTQYKGKISDYIYYLYYESYKIAKQNHSEQISSEHVEFASSKIVKARRSGLNNLLTTIGGILVGATVSNIFSITSFGVTYSNTGIVLTIAAGAIGSFILGYCLLND
jgi:hypothetical protein